MRWIPESNSINRYVPRVTRSSGCMEGDCGIQALPIADVQIAFFPLRSMVSFLCEYNHSINRDLQRADVCPVHVVHELHVHVFRIEEGKAFQNGHVAVSSWRRGLYVQIVCSLKSAPRPCATRWSPTGPSCPVKVITNHVTWQVTPDSTIATTHLVLLKTTVLW